MREAMSSQWTFADVWETVADMVPDRLAQMHGARCDAWSTFDRRADGIASALLGAGLRHQDKVALYLYNVPEYLEAAFAALKAGLVPVNTNYRYVRDELLYIWQNADAAAVIFQGRFDERVEELRGRCPAVRQWLRVDDGSGSCPPWAVPYEQAASSANGRTRATWGRSGDDQILVYTGGTTGLPKGVMWRQHDLFIASNVTRDPLSADLDTVRARIAASPPQGPVGLPAAPLMHGTAFVFACTILNRAGIVATVPGTRFDAAQLLDAIDALRVSDLCIVGDAFCLPMVEALEGNHGRWTLGSLKVVSSSGMAWTASVKERLLAHAPGALLIDFLNSSEASGLGRSLASKGRVEKSGTFKLGDNAFVIDDRGDAVAPGSGIVGRLAVRGHVPIGYYKDPVKSKATFPVINGVRCAVPGDFATVEADGAITLLGRGSVSINTGGEKVFPDEVEAAIKVFPGIRDVLVVGIPDQRLGQIVAVAVETSLARPLNVSALTAHLRAHLAGYKVPRAFMVVESIERGPNGKADYAKTQRRVADWLATRSEDQRVSAGPQSGRR